MSRSKRVNFVRQQGFREADASACALSYPALMFQPRVVGVLLAVGALVFGRFCLGSFLFHHLRGDGVFARRTAPWASGE